MNVLSSFFSQVISPETTGVKIKPLGYSVPLKATNEKHFNFIPEDKENPMSFLNYVKNSMLKSNDMLVDVDLLSQEMTANPDSVSVDDVMIAAKEAELMLNLQKTVINKLITGYKELINIR